MSKQWSVVILDFRLQITEFYSLNFRQSKICNLRSAIAITPTLQYSFEMVCVLRVVKLIGCYEDPQRVQLAPPFCAARFLSDQRSIAPTMPPGSSGFSDSELVLDLIFSTPPQAVIAVCRHSRKWSQRRQFSCGWMMPFSSLGMQFSGMPKQEGLVSSIRSTPRAKKLRARESRTV